MCRRWLLTGPRLEGSTGPRSANNRTSTGLSFRGTAIAYTVATSRTALKTHCKTNRRLTLRAGVRALFLLSQSALSRSDPTRTSPRASHTGHTRTSVKCEPLSDVTTTQSAACTTGTSYNLSHIHFTSRPPCSLPLAPLGSHKYPVDPTSHPQCPMLDPPLTRRRPVVLTTHAPAPER